MTDATFFATKYDRGACDVGVVHVGFGAFHRAHQAVYIDDYMHATADLRWGIAAVNLRPSEAATFEVASTMRDGYLLKSIAPDGSQEFRVVRSHIAFCDASTDMDAALALFAKPSVHLASLTVTESGYSFNDDWTLNLSEAPIAGELSGGPIATIYGYLSAALERRRATTAAPMTIMCCDNIRNNGRLLEAALHQYLIASDKADLSEWVSDNVRFPCSMVDRITPRSTPALEEEVKHLWPGQSIAPIHAEDFVQWVLEDSFAGPMPDLAKAGVEIVADVEPFEEAKIRLLNGGHTGLAYLGALGGHQTFDAAMGDARLRPTFEAWQDDVMAGLGNAFPFDLMTYRKHIARRFENPGIADQLERICMDGYSKMGLYMRPTLEACLDQGRVPKAGYACVASWVVYARKVAAGTMPIAYHDPFWDRLLPSLSPGSEALLAQDPNLWGDLPTRHSDFVTGLTAAIQQMEDQWQD